MKSNDIQRYRNEINKVFRPGAPIEKYDLFAGRTDQIMSVLDAIHQQGMHVIIYGERGVGKTSLAKIISILAMGDDGIYSPGIITCDSADNFSTMWRKVFNELTFTRKAKKLGFAEDEVTGVGLEEVELGSLADDPVMPDDIRRILSLLSLNSIIVFDEIDRIRDKESTTLLADTIKILSDHAVPTTLIIVGVADSVDDLIAEHRSIQRCLVQVPMPRMSTEEQTDIVNRSLDMIGMTIEADALKWIVRLSQGLPHFTHLLSQNAALHAVQNSRLTIVTNDVFEATKSAVSKPHSMLSDYHKATSSPQKQNLFAQVLLACALAPTDELGYFAAKDVCTPMSEIMGKSYGVPSFARHLSEFCTDTRGSILQKIGTTRKVRYRFVNPLLQPYVIMHGYSDGLLTNKILERQIRWSKFGKA